jgi:hypothetical protein
LEKLYDKNPKTHYMSKPTKPRERIKRLEAKKRWHDEMRWTILPKALLKKGVFVNVVL